ncbi:MAG: hypothetical protein ACKV22_20330 [Bryobacteraceae bacterium]
MSQRITRNARRSKGTSSIRKKGDTCARIEFGPPKTDKSRRTLDYRLPLSMA